MSPPTLSRLVAVPVKSQQATTALCRPPSHAQAVPLETLVERTFATTRQEVEKNHARWLKENRHLRYMWLPYTDAVVVVQVNPASSPAAAAAAAREAAAAEAAGGGEARRAEPLRALLAEAAPGKAAEAEGERFEGVTLDGAGSCAPG